MLESIADWIDCNAQLEKVPRVFITGSVSSHPVARNLLTKYLDGKLWTRGRVSSMARIVFSKTSNKIYNVGHVKLIVSFSGHQNRFS